MRDHYDQNFLDCQEELIKKLENPEYAQAYLNAALMDDNERHFLLALKNVLEAQGSNITALAQKTNLNRENLYRMLSKKGNPRLVSIMAVLNAMGLQISIKPRTQIRNIKNSKKDLVDEKIR